MVREIDIACFVGSGPLRAPPGTVFFNEQVIGIATPRMHGFDAVTRDGAPLGRFNDISAAIRPLIAEHEASASKGIE